MTTEAEALAFYQLSQRRALKRFLEIPEAPTGFDMLDYGTKHGREQLVQIRDFDQEAA